MLKQVLLSPAVLIRQIINEHSCKSRLAPDRTEHGLLRDRSNSAVTYCCGGSEPHGHIMKARFSEKLPLQRFAEEIFYAMLNSGKLHAAVLNEEHKVRLCALVKDFLMIFVIFLFIVVH